MYLCGDGERPSGDNNLSVLFAHVLYLGTVEAAKKYLRLSPHRFAGAFVQHESCDVAIFDEDIKAVADSQGYTELIKLTNL